MSANNESENQLKKEQWAERLGLKESKDTPHFCLCRLLGESCQEFGSTACINTPPGSDHASLWLLDGKPSVFVYQPYGLTKVTELGEFCRARGLDCTIATRPAWHNPGSVLHIEITKAVKEKTAETPLDDAATSLHAVSGRMFDSLNDKEKALVRRRFEKKEER